MRALLAPLSRILSAISAVCLWIAGIGLVGMTAVVGWQVFGRYVLNSTPTWSEPLTLQLMGWFILLGAAVGVRENFHIGLDLLHHVLPKSIGRVLDAISLVLIAGFGVAMAWYSGQLAAGTWSARLPALGIPGGFDFLPQVVGGVLIASFSLERLVQMAMGIERADAPLPATEVV